MVVEHEASNLRVSFTTPAAIERCKFHHTSTDTDQKAASATVPVPQSVQVADAKVWAQR